MSPEAQQIAIAKLCGWTQDADDAGICYSPDGDLHYWDNAPDYLNDLNAMHEAEKVLFANWHLYYAQLVRVCKQAHDHEVHATARQRAEAFLRTLGKWKDV